MFVCFFNPLFICIRHDPIIIFIWICFLKKMSNYNCRKKKKTTPIWWSYNYQLNCFNIMYLKFLQFWDFYNWYSNVFPLNTFCLPKYFLHWYFNHFYSKYLSHLEVQFAHYFFILQIACFFLFFFSFLTFLSLSHYLWEILFPTLMF